MSHRVQDFWISAIVRHYVQCMEATLGPNTTLQSLKKKINVICHVWKILQVFIINRRQIWNETDIIKCQIYFICFISSMNNFYTSTLFDFVEYSINIYHNYIVKIYHTKAYPANLCLRISFLYLTCEANLQIHICIRTQLLPNWWDWEA